MKFGRRGSFDKSGAVSDEFDGVVDESGDSFGLSGGVFGRFGEAFDGLDGLSGLFDEAFSLSDKTPDESGEGLCESCIALDSADEVLDESGELSNRSGRVLEERYLIMGTTMIPTREDERVTWSLNFEDNFPMLGADLGFNATEIANLISDSAMMRYVIMNAQTAAAFSKACTAHKNAMIGGVGDNVLPPELPAYNTITPPTKVNAGVLDRLSKAIQRAKLSSKFNQAVAEQLMIAAAAPDNSIAADAKPKASATSLTGSVVRIEWTKGKFDGVFIDSQRVDEAAWTRLDFDMRSPYEDSRPPTAAGKPEERRYRLRYFIDNKEVGVWSDVIVVITLP